MVASRLQLRFHCVAFLLRGFIHRGLYFRSNERNVGGGEDFCEDLPGYVLAQDPCIIVSPNKYTGLVQLRCDCLIPIPRYCELPLYVVSLETSLAQYMINDFMNWYTFDSGGVRIAVESFYEIGGYEIYQNQKKREFGQKEIELRKQAGEVGNTCTRESHKKRKRERDDHFYPKVNMIARGCRKDMLRYVLGETFKNCKYYSHNTRGLIIELLFLREIV
jgi:hypothetical protein